MANSLSGSSFWDITSCCSQISYFCEKFIMQPVTTYSQTIYGMFTMWAQVIWLLFLTWWSPSCEPNRHIFLLTYRQIQIFNPQLNIVQILRFMHLPVPHPSHKRSHDARVSTISLHPKRSILCFCRVKWKKDWALGARSINTQQLRQWDNRPPAILNIVIHSFEMI